MKTPVTVDGAQIDQRVKTQLGEFAVQLLVKDATIEAMARRVEELEAELESAYASWRAGKQPPPPPEEPKVPEPPKTAPAGEKKPAGAPDVAKAA